MFYNWQIKSSKNFPRNYTAPELFILYCSGDKVGYNLPLGLGFKVPDQFWSVANIQSLSTCKAGFLLIISSIKNFIIIMDGNLFWVIITLQSLKLFKASLYWYVRDRKNIVTYLLSFTATISIYFPFAKLNIHLVYYLLLTFNTQKSIKTRRCAYFTNKINSAWYISSRTIFGKVFLLFSHIICCTLRMLLVKV